MKEKSINNEKMINDKEWVEANPIDIVIELNDCYENDKRIPMREIFLNLCRQIVIMQLDIIKLKDKLKENDS
jgi:hypothetical protein